MSHFFVSPDNDVRWHPIAARLDVAFRGGIVHQGADCDGFDDVMEPAAEPFCNLA